MKQESMRGCNSKQKGRGRGWLPALILCLLGLAIPAAGEIVVSEIMAANGIYDNGEAYDWIELYNDGADQDLSGWQLSDNAADGQALVFAPGARIKSGGRLLIYCIGQDKKPSAKGYYAPFKLDSQGETLTLARADGSVAQTLAYPQQYGNTAWGLPQGQAQYAFLPKATPQEKNPSQGYPARIEAPLLPPGGFFDQAIEVTVAAPAAGEVRYTLDGSEPTASSKKYQKPLRISKTTVLRCRAWAQGLLPSPTASATYFIKDAPACAVVSLSTDKDYLFDKRIGALVKGSGGSTPNYEKELEYPINIEYFDAQGQPIINQMGTFTASGHSARINAQKSIAIYARAAYGPERFSFNPFPNRSYRDYKSLLLRSANSDAYSTRLRDPVISSCAQGLGLLYQDALPIVVYLNGEYWGHYNLREKINKHFVAQWEGVTKASEIDKIDILARTGADEFVQNGSNKDWLALMNYCKTHDLNKPENLQYVTDRLDVDNFFAHTIFEMIVGNTDMTNIRMYRVPGGKWKYLLFDVEAGFLSLKEIPISYYIKDINAKRARFQHVHLSALLKVPQMRAKFLQMFGDILSSNFLWPDVEKRFAPWEQTLQALLPRHIKRWKNLKWDDWLVNVKAVKYYARVRPLKVIDLICAAMDVARDERAQYFGRAEELLKQYNGK